MARGRTAGIARDRIQAPRAPVKLRNTDMNTKQTIIASGAIFGLAASAIGGTPEFSISSYSIAGGAGVLQNGTLSLVGSTGQPVVASGVMGGGFSLTSGFTPDAGGPPPCPADLTGDGVLNFFDVSAFLGAYSAQLPQADFTGDGIYNFFDVSAFLGLYTAGCP